MKTERWESLKDLLHQAMLLAPEKRDSFLDKVCSSDRSLRGELESLLAAEEDLRSSFMQSPTLADELLAGAGNPVSDGKLSPAQTFAQRFRLIRRLGQGGMGQVWLAEQISPVRRQVALKLIKAGMYDEAVVRRFRSERQALAIMDHPAIAKVFDAGTTEQGQPFFVMEYVPGVPITDYCDQKTFTIGQRLELFAHVCEGVQHAHQKAIIHRDLKPANILVVEVDGKPVPRIIDFGLAKAVAAKADDETMFTQLGSFVGTPGFMSPEQADPTSVDIDTRTDMYSLGVVLYVLLTGVLPLDVSIRGQPLAETLRKLREEEPQRPSTRVSSDCASSTAAATARGTEPAQLVGLLRGDLDWITMKALEKDRARRYGTPSELAADIHRYLNHEPVLARPAAVSYRLRKYARRHRVGVSVAVVLALLLVGFTVLQAAQLRRTTRERDRANRERDRATRITDFMTGMFNVSDPDQARGNSITAREVLDKASSSINQSLQNDPDLRAQLLMAMGRVYDNLGLYSQAQSLHQSALDIRQRIFGPKNFATLGAAEEVSWDLSQLGRYQEAENLSRSALDVARQALGPDDPYTLNAMYNRGWILGLQGRFGEAEQVDRETVERRRRVLGPENRDTLNAMNNLAEALQDQGKYAEAVALQQQTLAIQRKVLGPDAQGAVDTMTNLGVSLSAEQHYAEAEKLYRDALDIDRRVLGPEAPNTLRIRLDLAVNLHEQHRFAESEMLDSQTLEIARRVLGSTHPHVLAVMNNIALTLENDGKYRESENVYRQLIELERNTYGPDDPRTLATSESLGEVLMDQNRLTEAKKILEDTVVVERRVLGSDNPATSLTIYNLACIAARSQRPQEALSLLSDAVEHHLKPESMLQIDQDTDLKSLHRNPKFATIVARAKAKAAGQQKLN